MLRLVVQICNEHLTSHQERKTYLEIMEREKGFECIDGMREKTQTP